MRSIRPARFTLAASCLLSMMPCLLNAAPGDELYTRPGQIVASDGTRLNLYCMGSGSPAVVFDSGWEDWAPVWTIVQPRVAQWTRACSYDRAGAGFSEPGPMPRTSVRIADELHSALHNAGVAGPYILVGHAFGGDNVRTFAVRYMSEVAGMVLVEADVGGLNDHRGDAGRVAELRECRDAVAAGKALPLLPARPGRPDRTCAQQFFRGLPEQAWSPQLNAKLLELAQTKVAMYDAYMSEMEQMRTDEIYLEQHPRSFGSRPIRVLSTGYHGIHEIDPARPKTAEQQKYEEQVARAQARWLALSSNAKQLFATNSSEYIPFDQPDFVVDAIHQVYGDSNGVRALPTPSPRMLDIRAPDGVLLKASYFAATRPGPGALLFHQSNRSRRSWDDLAARLAAAGISTLAIDNRGHGESGGQYDKWNDPSRDHSAQTWPADLDAAFETLLAQPGVERERVGVGGAGLLGVDNAVETARRHSAAVKSLVLISGETLRPQLQFLHEAAHLPGLFVVADDDEYPPTAEAMAWLYATSTSPQKQLVHYVGRKAPWLWYEPFDIGRVPALGGHGTDLFKGHPELPGVILDWWVTTLINTPGEAPADAVASASVLNQIAAPGGVAPVTEMLLQARRQDPTFELFPEINVSIIGNDYLRAGDSKQAIEVFKLNLLAYPDSADARADLADACLQDGQQEVARQYAQQALALLDSHAAPASSWSDTEQRRAEIRRDAEKTLKRSGPGSW